MKPRSQTPSVNPLVKLIGHLVCLTLLWASPSSTHPTLSTHWHFTGVKALATPSTPDHKGFGKEEGSLLLYPLVCVFLFVLFLYVHFFLSFVFRATPAAYRGSQARGQTVAVATALRHSHSNTRSEPHLRPTPQLTATLDP